MTQSDPNGLYTFGGLTLDASYSLLFFEPPTHVFSPQDQGADDLLDSDVDPVLGETPILPLMDGLDPVRWDMGMVPVCIPPDEPIYVESVTLGPGNETILSFQDFNQPSQVTGHNIYRSGDPGPPPSTWPLLASDVVDGDSGTPNIQWADTTGDPPPGGIWYYDVTAYNSRCPAERPF